MSKKLNKIIIGLSVALIMMVGSIAGTVALSKNKEKTDTIEISAKNEVNSLEVYSSQTEENNLKAFISEQKIDNVEENNGNVDKIQGTTITRVVEGDLKKVKEERVVSWKLIDLELEAKSAKINNTEIVGKPEFVVEKSSNLVKASGNTHAEVAEYGDTIKYTIKINNNGKVSGIITIKDKVPEGTTLLPYDAKTTNLTLDEFNKLNSEDGLLTKLEVGANNGKTLEFTVTVTGTAGSKISNVATYITDEKEENVKDPKEYQIEREIKITKNTENIKTTNSNIVLVMDISGSMANNNRLTNAKTAAKKLIDGVDFSSEGQIGIVTFSSGGWSWNDDNAQTLNISNNKEYAVNAQEALILKNKVEALNAKGGTRIADGLVKAKTLIEKMATQKPKNNNIVIVLSDAAYNVEQKDNGTYGNELINTGGETVTRVTEKANNLKNSSAKPQIYAIAILAQNETPGNTEIMTKRIPSSTENYIKATDGYENLIAAFKKIESNISGSATQTKLSKNGIVELEDIKTVDSVVIKIGGQKISNPQEYLKTENGKTYVDLTKFEDKKSQIEIEYMT